MAGVKVTVLRKTTITLPAVVGAASVTLPPLAEFVNTIGWVSGTLQVRVYDNSLTGTTAKVIVAVINAAVAPEDPAVTLTELVTGGPLAVVEIVPAFPAAAALMTSYIPTPDPSNNPYPAIAESVSVIAVVEAGQGTTVGGSITIGIDLIGRNA